MNKASFFASIALSSIPIHKKELCEQTQYIYKTEFDTTYYFKIRAKQSMITFYKQEAHKITSHKKYYSYMKAFASLQRRVNGSTSKNNG